jgi:hypothetical protein
MSTPTATPAANRASLPRPGAVPSYASLRRREAREQHAPSARGRLLALPYAAYAESIEGADARLRAEACPLDLYDLRDDGAEPF